MLATSLRRHAGHAPLDDLEQRLLGAFAGDVAGDGGAVGLARDLVYLVDVDDAPLRLGYIEVRRLDKVEQDVLDILADVPRLSEGSRVGDGEGNVEHLGEGARQQGLAAARRPGEQDGGLLPVDAVRAMAAGDALVVVVHGNAPDLLGLVLADDVVAGVVADGAGDRRRDGGRLAPGAALVFLEDVLAEDGALGADGDGARAGRAGRR